MLKPAVEGFEILDCGCPPTDDLQELFRPGAIFFSGKAYGEGASVDVPAQNNFGFFRASFRSKF